MSPVVGLAEGDPFSLGFGESSVLEAAFGKDRHLHSRDLTDAARHDLPLQGVEARDVPTRERDEWNTLRGRDDLRPHEGAESLEPEAAQRRVAAGAGPALSTGVGLGVLEGADPPTLL